MPAMNRSDRIAKVEDALAALPTAIANAKLADTKLVRNEINETEAHAVWERVEMLGAIVHRQSRILAGKSRGG